MIVVGVDSSPGAQHALDWAIREAALRSASLRVVHVWELPYRESEIAILASEPVREPLERAAHAVLDNALREAGATELDIERVVVEGPPARGLLEAATDAELLVVGSRGHGGFAGLLLGSVSQQCVQHTRCPVVIVRRPHA